MLAIGAAGCGRQRVPLPVTPLPPTSTKPTQAIIPAPSSIAMAPSDTFTIDSTTAIVVASGAGPEAERIAGYLATLLGGPLAAPARTLSSGESAPPKSIALLLDPSKTSLGLEGYDLGITRSGVTLTAAQPNGLFYGVQTLRQLLPWSVEH